MNNIYINADPRGSKVAKLVDGGIYNIDFKNYDPMNTVAEIIDELLKNEIHKIDIPFYVLAFECLAQSFSTLLDKHQEFFLKQIREELQVNTFVKYVKEE